MILTSILFILGLTFLGYGIFALSVKHKEITVEIKFNQQMDSLMKIALDPAQSTSAQIEAVTKMSTLDQETVVPGRDMMYLLERSRILQSDGQGHWGQGDCAGAQAVFDSLEAALDIYESDGNKIASRVCQKEIRELLLAIGSPLNFGDDFHSRNQIRYTDEISVN